MPPLLLACTLQPPLHLLHPDASRGFLRALLQANPNLLPNRVHLLLLSGNPPPSKSSRGRRATNGGPLQGSPPTTRSPRTRKTSTYPPKSRVPRYSPDQENRSHVAPPKPEARRASGSKTKPMASRPCIPEGREPSAPRAARPQTHALRRDQRKRLAGKGHALGRRVLREFEPIVTLDTILRWHRVSRSTVRRILKERGIGPAPERLPHMPWSKFLKGNWEAIAAAGFFTVEVWTSIGLVRYLVFLVIDLSTRRVEIAGIVPVPNGLWMRRAART